MMAQLFLVSTRQDVKTIGVVRKGRRISTGREVSLKWSWVWPPAPNTDVFLRGMSSENRAIGRTVMSAPVSSKASMVIGWLVWVFTSALIRGRRAGSNGIIGRMDAGSRLEGACRGVGGEVKPPPLWSFLGAKCQWGGLVGGHLPLTLALEWRALGGDSPASSGLGPDRGGKARGEDVAECSPGSSGLLFRTGSTADLGGVF